MEYRKTELKGAYQKNLLKGLTQVIPHATLQ